MISRTTDFEHQPSDLRFIEAERLRLFRAGGVTRLTLEGDRSWISAAPARAFPVSDPDRYIGFLDGDGKEIGLLVEPSQLDADSRRVLEEELAIRYFTPTVERVVSVKEEFGSVYWDVETDRGRKEIIVRNLRDNLQELGGGGAIITDVDGNRFYFPDPASLDSASFGIIMRSL